MKIRLLPALLIPVTLGFVLGFWIHDRSSPRPEPAPPEPVAAGGTARSEGPSPVVAGPAEISSGSPARSEPSGAAPESGPADDARPSAEADLRRIEDAMSTYEPGALPVIEPYLTHAEPALRESARLALLQMGLAEAAPVLRRAAERVKDPREAIELLDAADFLELPSLPVTGGAPRPVTDRPAGRVSESRLRARPAEPAGSAP